MRKNVLMAVMMACTIAGTGVAVAGVNPAATTKQDASNLLEGISHGALHYMYSFNGPSKNVVGVVAQSANGQKMMGWMVDGKYLMPGPMFNNQGENLTMEAARDHNLIPKPIKTALLARDAMAADGFTVGKKGPMVIAFMDPNCIFCHKFWETVQPEIKAGDMRLKVVPVGFLKPSSFPKAVTIMQQKDPAAAWTADEAGFNVAKEEGSTVPAKKLSAKYSQVIHMNTALLAKSGEVATPTVMMCSKGEKLPTLMHGVPQTGLKKMIGDAVSVEASGTCAG